MPDWNIFEELARALGRPMGYFGVDDIFREMTMTIPHWKGLKARDLEGDGKVVPPFPDRDEGFRGDRRFHFAPVRVWESPVRGAEEYPFELIAGRSMYQFGSTSTRSKNLQHVCPEGYVEINSDDAKDLGLAEGDLVTVTSPSGSFFAPAKLSSAVRQGMVFAPINFPGLGVYTLFQENTTVCRVKVQAHDGKR
jgi:predicted molibdopterin-dependent oxidoreductase YjgC